METATAYQREASKATPKSPYNSALGYFKGHGKIALQQHDAVPYAFTDQTLADAMRGLVDRVRTLDPEERSKLELDIRDTALGLGITLSHQERQRGIAFYAEPGLDGDVLKYEARVQLLSGSHTPREVELLPNSKKALRGISRRSTTVWYGFLTGLLGQD